MRHVCAAAALSLSLLPVTAVGAQSAPVTTVPILFSVSGAASLGTYQSGATWAVLRFLKLANTDSTLRPRGRKNIQYQLGALSGTSAGNINALISALEWCRREPVNPDSSLFAQLWLDVGLGQLNPANSPPASSAAASRAGLTSAGLLSRAFFATLWDTITTSMRRPIWDQSCNIPIGVTLTRIVPALYALQRNASDSALTASTQRFVTRWRVESDSAALGAATTMSLRPPATPVDARMFGAEYLIDAAPDASKRDTVDRNIVFHAVQASASVPLVWAAVPLPTPNDSNWAARELHHAAGTTAVKKPNGSALFVDGGVFDSDPLSLAVDLWSAEPVVPKSSDSHPLLIRIDPSDLRGLLLLDAERDAAATPATKQPPAAGLEPVFALMGGFVPSARQYEMQSLGRALAQSASNPRSPQIVHTTRAFHTTAEYFYSFSGFLGRPFRDHDFYLGIYDGMRFAAQQLVCGDPTAPDRPPASASCVDSVLINIIIPAMARATPGGTPPLVLEFAHCEASGWKQCAFPSDTTPKGALLRSRDAVIATMARMSEKLLQYSPPPVDSLASLRCGPRPCDNLVASLLWSDGFGGMLAGLAADTQYQHAIANIRKLTIASKPACWNAASMWGSTDGTCLADDAFVRLVNDPERFLDFAFRWELRWLVEIEAGQPHVSGTVLRAAIIAEMLYTAQAFPYRRSFFAPTTVPETEPAHVAWNLAPYYVSAGVFGTGGVEAGWDFTLRYWRDAHIGLTTPVSVWYRSAPAGGRSSTAVAAGIGAYYRPLDNRWLNFQLAVQYSGEAAARGLVSARMISSELAWTPPLLTKLRLGYRYGPQLYDASRPTFGPASLGRGGGAFSLGVQDLPGIAYWAWRLF